MNFLNKTKLKYMPIFLYEYRYTSPVWGRVRIPPPSPCESQKATERKSGAWGYNSTTLSLGDVNTETWSTMLGAGRKADDFALYERITVAKSKDVKPR
jgi:hypothetical protein